MLSNNPPFAFIQLLTLKSQDSDPITNHYVIKLLYNNCLVEPTTYTIDDPTQLNKNL